MTIRAPKKHSATRSSNSQSDCHDRATGCVQSEATRRRRRSKIGGTGSIFWPKCLRLKGLLKQRGTTAVQYSTGVVPVTQNIVGISVLFSFCFTTIFVIRDIPRGPLDCSSRCYLVEHVRFLASKMCFAQTSSKRGNLGTCQVQPRDARQITQNNAALITKVNIKNRPVVIKRRWDFFQTKITTKREYFLYYLVLVYPLLHLENGSSEVSDLFFNEYASVGGARHELACVTILVQFHTLFR